MAHRFVEDVFAEGLSIVYGEGRNKCDGHLPYEGVARSPGAQDTFCCVHKTPAHELQPPDYWNNLGGWTSSPCSHEVEALGM